MCQHYFATYNQWYLHIIRSAEYIIIINYRVSGSNSLLLKSIITHIDFNLPPSTPPTTADHRRPPPTTADHRWPPPTTADHRRPPLTTADHRWPPPTTADHRWPPLTTADHHCPPMTADDLRWPPPTNVEPSNDLLVYRQQCRRVSMQLTEAKKDY